MNKTTLIKISAAGVLGVLLGLMVGRMGDRTTVVESGSKVEPIHGTAVNSAAIANVLIQTSPVEMQDISEVLSVNGKIALNGLKVHQISSRIPGRIDRVSMVEGSSVKAGESLAWIYSPEFISAQNEFLLAKRTVRTLNNQATQDLYADASATLEGARNKLRILGASNAEILQLEKTGIAQEYMAIASPINGKITKRNVDPGGYLDTGSSLGSVADMSSLWFLGNAFEGNLVKLKEGLDVSIKVAGVSAAQLYRGKISFIAPTVDPQTHTVAVRVDLSNLDGVLKPDMFAKAEINVGHRKLPVVPRSSVVQDGAESFVVRQKVDGSYERISVVALPANDIEHLAIISGVISGDRVVVEGGVLVDRAVTNSSKMNATPTASQVTP